MSSRTRGTRLTGKRTSAVAAIAATVVTAACLLTPAPAAAATLADTAVTIAAASQNTNQQAGTGVVLDVTYTQAPGAGTAAPLYFSVLSGPATTPATPAFPAGTPCTLGAGDTATCSITNAGTPGVGTPGTDQIEIFADNDGSGTYTPGDVIAQTSVTFSGIPATLSITPTSSTSTNGTCVLYTFTALDNQGKPAVGRDLSVAVTENSTSAPGPFRFFDTSCAGAPITPVGTNITATSITDTVPVTTLNDGTYSLGIASNDSTADLAALTGTGHVTVTSVDNTAVSQSATATWDAGGANAVTALTVTAPTSVTQYTGTTASYTITATDHNGNPVQNVTVNAESDAASPDDPNDPCGTTDEHGQVTCTVDNTVGDGPGTDTLTFWVDNTLPGPHTPGPDANEPQARATALFRTAPSVDTETLTCVDQLATDKNLPASTCTLPTTQPSVTFTETLTDLGTPVVGAVVEFHVTTARLGGVAPVTPIPNAFATTDATGTATFTVSDPNAANSDFVDVNSFLGATLLNSAEAKWQTAAPSALTLTPALQSVTKGAQVSVVAQVSDQFGAPVVGVKSISYSAVGTPDNVNPAPVTTDAAGTTTITYTSSPLSIGEDTITAVDTTDALVAPAANVEFINGAPTAATVTVDTTGNGTSAVCPSTTGTPNNTNLPLVASNTLVCAVVKNAGGEVLAGKTVTFSVDIGQVDATNPTSTSTKTYVATTNKSGVATAVVTSSVSGTQTVTATADSASGTGTLMYAGATPDKARNIKVSPVSATIIAGNQQKFTWTVTDQFSNPVSGVTLSYVQAGAGLSGATSSGTLLTGPDGTASLVVTTQSTDNGAGSVTATIEEPTPPTPLDQCGDLAGNPATTTTDGNCTAAATYTVLGASTPASVSLKIAGGITKGHDETITATVKNADGSPAANQVIRFLVTGANGVIGSSVTNAAGIATFTYLASHAGVDAITAYDDINDDQVQQGNEPGHHTKAIITGVTDRPTIHLTSFAGTVIVHVSTHPAMAKVLVTYFVKRYGAFRKIGTSRAGTLGRASMEFFFPKGVVRRFKARVNSKQGITGAKTVAKTITVR